MLWLSPDLLLCLWTGPLLQQGAGPRRRPPRLGLPPALHCSGSLILPPDLSSSSPFPGLQGRLMAQRLLSPGGANLPALLERTQDPKLIPLAPLIPARHHSHFPLCQTHTEQGRATGWFQQEGLMAVPSLFLPPCTEGEALGSRERGRAQGPALRKSNSRQITAFSLKPSHNHSQCRQGNGTRTGKGTPARRRGLHVRSLGPSLNFPSGAQVCQPGPAQRGSSSVCRVTIGHGG